MVTDWLTKLEFFFNVSWANGLIVSFLAGLLTSFSPCIYPLIPITLAVIGTTSVSSRLKSFSVSLIFVLGICFTYTAIGVFAAILGIMFGSFFMNPVSHFILAVFFILLGLTNLGIIKINFSILTPNLATGKGKFSLFILGAVSSLAIIPCNFPVLGTILSLISLKKNIVYASISLFLFSLGYGMVLLILGTFTSLIIKLPKQGKWLTVIKNLLSLILLMTGLVFLIKGIKFINPSL